MSKLFGYFQSLVNCISGINVPDKWKLLACAIAALALFAASFFLSSCASSLGVSRAVAPAPSVVSVNLADTLYIVPLDTLKYNDVTPCDY